MASNALLLLVGVPENYRLGGPAFQRLHEAHARVQVRIVHDQAEFARQVAQADAVIGTRPYLKLAAEVAKPGARLQWVQTTTVGVDRVVPPALLAAEHLTLTRIKGPPGPLMAEHAVLLMLALSRNLPTYLENQRRHIWRREGQDWLPLHGQTVAILGVGSGGGNLARVCKSGFGMTGTGPDPDAARNSSHRSRLREKRAARGAARSRFRRAVPSEYARNAAHHRYRRIRRHEAHGLSDQRVARRVDRRGCPDRGVAGGQDRGRGPRRDGPGSYPR